MKIERALSLNVQQLADNIRDIDANEVVSLHSEDKKLEDILHNTIDVKNTYSVFNEDELIAMFGVNKNNIIWCLATNAINKCKKTAYILALDTVNEILTQTGFLCNYILASNKKGIKYLKSLGFKTTSKNKIFKDNKKFIYFYKVLKTKCKEVEHQSFFSDVVRG